MACFLCTAKCCFIIILPERAPCLSGGAPTLRPALRECTPGSHVAERVAGIREAWGWRLLLFGGLERACVCVCVSEGAAC